MTIGTECPPDDRAGHAAVRAGPLHREPRGIPAALLHPGPVVGGLIFAIFHLVVHQTGLLTLTFDETLKNVFMIWFFTSVGYGASFKVLRRGAGPVLVFLLLATVMITMQNFGGRRLRPAVRLG